MLRQPYLSNGTWRMLTVHWNAATKALTYDLEGVGTNTYVVSDLNAHLAQQRFIGALHHPQVANTKRML